MKPNAKKRSANKNGAVLVTAVCVLLVMSILMSATIGYVATNRKKTNSNYSKKQAYLTASNTLKGFVEKVKIMTGKPADDGSGPEGTSKDAAEQLQNIQALQALAAADGGKGTEIDVTYDDEVNQSGYRIGTTRLRISQDNGSASDLVLTATTTYGNETEKVAAHISLTAKKKPARFTNTIEWMGKDGLDLNNLSVVGDTAVLDQDNQKKVYQLTNDVQLKGSLYIWGSIKNKATGGQSIDFHPNIQDNSRGSFVQVSRDWYGDLKATSYKQGNDGFNYVYVGGTMYIDNSTGGAGKVDVGRDNYEIDIITHSVKASTNGWNQKGNLYVYKNKADSTIINNGSFILNSGDVNIDGDVFIEGDLVVNGGSFKCKNLDVAGTITGSVTVTGKKSVGADAKIDKPATGRGSKPEMNIDSSTYKYMPEDFFMNNDGVSNEDFAKKYADFYNGKNTYDLLNDSPSYTDPDTGAKFNYYVRQSCSFTLDFDIYGKNGAYKNKKGVPWDKDYIILIDVDDSTKDVLVRLKDGVLLGGNSKNC
ncbi:MAG: polymer-forming cytoskeletal protein, partial [Ruminococcus sp.]|nr:polymer-forming cytoskeletal protein [Ruminococcus sp.]